MKPKRDAIALYKDGLLSEGAFATYEILYWEASKEGALLRVNSRLIGEWCHKAIPTIRRRLKDLVALDLISLSDPNAPYWDLRLQKGAATVIKFGRSTPITSDHTSANCDHDCDHNSDHQRSQYSDHQRSHLSPQHTKTKEKTAEPRARAPRSEIREDLSTPQVERDLYSKPKGSRAHTREGLPASALGGTAGPHGGAKTTEGGKAKEEKPSPHPPIVTAESLQAQWGATGEAIDPEVAKEKFAAARAELALIMGASKLPGGVA